jgi:hypothetical protein
MKKKQIPTEVWSENLKVRVYFRKLEDDRIILQLTLKKYDENSIILRYLS